MQATRQKKKGRVEQPTWEEWVSRGAGAAVKGKDERADPGLTHEAIANLAYSYWEARGRQGGSAEEDWLRAEAEMQFRLDKRA